MNMVTMGKYKDVSAVVLENEDLRAVVTPDFGARTASLVYKPQKRELLWQNPANVHQRPAYGDRYEKGEFAGFDEMFPTISRCFCEEDPWAGTEMPDHGEVWTLPWKFHIADDGGSAEFQARGVRFPYRLTKSLRLLSRNGGTVLRGEYILENLSHADFSCIWAAHPLFNTHPGMRFIVPGEMDRIVNAVRGNPLGDYGQEFAFPRAETAAGDIDLSEVPPKNDTGYQKYYFSQPMTEGWCLLYSPEWKLNIGVSFPTESVPYLGMWLNEGGYAGQYNIAPEPASGAMDRVDAAKLWGMDSVLSAGASRSWFLEISVFEGEQLDRVE